MSDSTNARVALGHEQRTALPRRLDGEAVPVDQARAPLDRVDPQTDPGQVQERQRGMAHDAHPLVGQQQLHGVLGHHR